MDLSSLPNYPSGKGVCWVQPPAVNRDFSRRGELLMKFLVLLAVLGAVFYLRSRLLSAGPMDGSQREMLVGRWVTEEATPLVIEFTQDNRFILFGKDRIFCVGIYTWEWPDEIEVAELRNGQGERKWVFQNLERELESCVLRFKATATKTELVIAESTARDPKMKTLAFNFPARNGNVLKFKRKQ